MTPDPFLDAQQVALAESAEALGALSSSFDPSTGTYHVLVPPGGSTELAPTTLPVEVRRATFTKAEYDAAMETITSLSWHPDAKTYVYGIALSAATGRIEVDTTAPAEVLQPLRVSLGEIVGFRIVAEGGPDSRPAGGTLT